MSNNNFSGYAISNDRYSHPIPNDNTTIPSIMVMTVAPVLTVAPAPLTNNSLITRDGQGNALCKKCSTPYPLHAGCTSWR